MVNLLAKPKPPLPYMNYTLEEDRFVNDYSDVAVYRGRDNGALSAG
jgi:hypothetical protein